MAPADGSGSDRRAGLWIAASVVLVVVAVLAGAYAVLAGGSDTPAPGATGDEPGDGQSAASTAFAPPVPVPVDGSYATSTVLDSGDVAVTEWIRSGQAIGELRLAVPRAPGLPRDGVSATDVTVVADGRPVRITSTVDATSPATVEVGDAEVAQVSYTLSGVLEEDLTGSRRALLRILGLDLDYAAENAGRVTGVHAVSGSSVLGMACTPRGALVPQPCGGPVDGVWQVTLEGDDALDRVQAQLELPRG